jgi:hypothetical protein
LQNALFYTEWVSDRPAWPVGFLSVGFGAINVREGIDITRRSRVDDAKE